MSFATQRFQFVGLDRNYLDSAATSLMPTDVLGAVTEYLATNCANAHSKTARRGRETTAAIEATRTAVGDLVGANADDAVIFIGSGATAALNLAAEVLPPTKAQPLVVISEMEHHSNMLPWRRAYGIDNVRYIPVLDDGTLDMGALRILLRQNKGKVRVVAVTAMSNVNGLINDVHAIAKMSHEAGALIVVDAAQAVPHAPFAMHDGEPLDFVALSGHKLYAPGSPGVLIGRKDLLDACAWDCGNVGGGIVDRVTLDTVTLVDDVAHKFEAGTLNIPGIVALGAGVSYLNGLTVAAVRAHEITLTRYLFSELARIENVQVYGPLDPTLRGGIIAVNIFGVPHDVVATELDSKWGSTVRNDCFCAQPYVNRQLDAVCNAKGFCAPRGEKRRGMVRCSFSPFTSESDLLRYATALGSIATRSPSAPAT